jgi:AraC family transcriptional regulator
MVAKSRREPAYGAQMAAYFGLPKPASLLIQPRAKPPLAITRLTSDVGLPERTGGIPAERAFVISVHLTPAGAEGCEIWVDDRYACIKHWPSGGIGIYDLESNPRTRNRGPVDWVHYHIPRATLDSFTDGLGVSRIETLQGVHGTADPVLHQLTQLILPSLDAPHAFSEFFLDYFRLLFCAHMAQRYAPSLETVLKPRGGLAPWQRRRAMNLLREHLDGSLRLATLAHECGLSVSHFARSFRQSFGTSAHSYLVLQRVERAKALLSTSTCTLCEVALQTGFSDQASFNRTFKALVGTPPGQWRRQSAIESGKFS